MEEKKPHNYDSCNILTFTQRIIMKYIKMHTTYIKEIVLDLL